MRIVAIDVDDITEAQEIQLLLPTTSRGIHRKQNRPCNAASYERDDAEKLDEA